MQVSTCEAAEWNCNLSCKGGDEKGVEEEGREREGRGKRTRKRRGKERRRRWKRKWKNEGDEKDE